ncbi:MAG: class I SAM-dependent methyltransferase [Acidimicrobiia bacterium]
MRANTNRARRLAFDHVVDEYDRARPRFGGAVVADLLEHAHLEPSDRVLEVGAGTGQLTDALLSADLEVVALEPGDRLAARLRERTMDRSARLTVVECFFEDYEAGDELFDAVVSANAFHWVDPDVSYAKSAALLRPDGTLVLLWSFPVAADATLQRRLNREVYFAELEGMSREPDGYQERLDDLVAAGRAEIDASGHFSVAWWSWHEVHREISVDDYLSLAVSLADGVERRAVLAARVHAALGRDVMIGLSEHVYVSVAQRGVARPN